MDEKLFQRIPVKMIMKYKPIAGILLKYIQELADPETISQLPDTLTIPMIGDYFNLDVDQKKALNDDFSLFLKKMGEIQAREDAEFGVEVDHSNPIHIWSNNDETIQNNCVSGIEEKYAGRIGEIIFYGPSNIQMWYSLENDMLPYKAQNHGMGGCIDSEMIKYAPRMLYAFKPSVVFFQTGSNDLALGLTLDQILDNKKKMYHLFLENLPDTKLVVMSGLPLPGRQEYWESTVNTNNLLQKLCADTDRMYFMDATDDMLSGSGTENMRTFDGRYFIPEYFRMDGIHLNKKGHDIWTTRMKETLKDIL